MTDVERCELCPGINNCIPASKSECNDYTVFFCGEAPGKDENRYNKVFIGKTGRELTEHYLPLAGLRRDHVTISNAIKCLPPGPKGKLDPNRAKDVALLYSCAATHLYQEILEHPYRVIVPMGTFACKAIDSGINLELQHGIPIETSFGTVFPMFHPALGIHEPKRMLMLRNDFCNLGRYLKGKLKIPKDHYPHPDYKLAKDEILDDYLEMECNDYTEIAMDTEVTRFREPWCMTYSTCPGTGRMVMADDKDSLEVFQTIVDITQGPILWHNWMFDSPVTEAMGLRLPHERIVDTMMLVYHLGNLPQGLKALAYRLLGMQMEDFDDLVTPHSVPLCLDYLEKAREQDWGKPEASLVRDEENNWKLYQPQSFNTKLKRFFTDMRNNPAKDIFDSWANWESSHEMIEAKLGRWPGKDIRYVPFNKALYYACRDADALIRLWQVLKRIRPLIRHSTQENWLDLALTGS